MQFDPQNSPTPDGVQEKPVVPVQGLADPHPLPDSLDVIQHATHEELTAFVDAVVLRPKDALPTIEIIKVLLEDPEEQLDGFRSLLCTVMAETMVRYCGDCPMEKIDPIYQTLELTDTVIGALLSNPRTPIPETMNDLMVANLDFVASLDEDRMLFEELHRTVDPTSRYDVFLTTIANTYNFALNHLEDLVGSGCFTPNERLVEAGHTLVGRQLAWIQVGCDPVQEERLQMVMIWRAALDFAAVMGDSEYANELKSVTQHLIVWEVKMRDNDEIVRDLERGGEEIDEDERMMRSEELELCVTASVRALRHCDDGNSLDIWKQVVAAFSPHTVTGRLGLMALAAEDITETELILRKMLTAMVKDGESKKAVARRMDTLDMYLNVPGAAGLFDDMFSGMTKHALDPVVHSKLIELFQERLNSHYACAEEGFRARDEAIRSNRYLPTVLEKFDKAGILWSARTRAALESVVNPQEAREES